MVTLWLNMKLWFSTTAEGWKPLFWCDERQEQHEPVSQHPDWARPLTGEYSACGMPGYGMGGTRDRHKVFAQQPPRLLQPQSLKLHLRVINHISVFDQSRSLDPSSRRLQVFIPSGFSPRFNLSLRDYFISFHHFYYTSITCQLPGIGKDG